METSKPLLPMVRVPARSLSLFCTYLPTLFVFLAQSIGAQGPGNYSVTCQTTAPQPITETLQALVLLGDSVMAGGNVTIHYRTRQLYILPPPPNFCSTSLTPTPLTLPPLSLLLQRRYLAHGVGRWSPGRRCTGGVFHAYSPLL